MKLQTRDEIKKLLYQNRGKFYVYGLWRCDLEKLFYIGKGHYNQIFSSLEKYEVDLEKIKFMIKFCQTELEANELEIKKINQYKGQLVNTAPDRKIIYSLPASVIKKRKRKLCPRLSAILVKTSMEEKNMLFHDWIEGNMEKLRNRCNNIGRRKYGSKSIQL